LLAALLTWVLAVYVLPHTPRWLLPNGNDILRFIFRSMIH